MAIHLTQGKELKGPGFDTRPPKILLVGLTEGFYCNTETQRSQLPNLGWMGQGRGDVFRRERPLKDKVKVSGIARQAPLRPVGVRLSPAAPTACRQ